MSDMNTNQVEQTPKKRKMLNAFTILFIITAVVAILTWIIPSGVYDVDAYNLNSLQSQYGTTNFRIKNYI